MVEFHPKLGQKRQKRCKSFAFIVLVDKLIASGELIKTGWWEYSSKSERRFG
jgi:hypothetical protein